MLVLSIVLLHVYVDKFVCMWFDQGRTVTVVLTGLNINHKKCAYHYLMEIVIEFKLYAVVSQLANNQVCLQLDYRYAGDLPYC